MSMMCSIYRLSEQQTQSLLAAPDSVSDLLGNSPLPQKTSFLSKLFGRSRSTTNPSESRVEPIAESEMFELDQAWHILHYLLSGCDAEGDWPAAFIMSGGQEVGPDLGYGPARLFSTDSTHEVANFLSTQSLETLEAAYVLEDIEAAEIYWQVSSSSVARQQQLEELWGMVQSLRDFLKKTVQTNGSILIQIF